MEIIRTAILAEGKEEGHLRVGVLIEDIERTLRWGKEYAEATGELIRELLELPVSDVIDHSTRYSYNQENNPDALFAFGITVDISEKHEDLLAFPLEIIAEFLSMECLTEMNEMEIRDWLGLPDLAQVNFAHVSETLNQMGSVMETFASNVGESFNNLYNAIEKSYLR